MEDKNKDQKPGFVCNQESQTNEESQLNVTVGPSAKSSSPSPSHDSTPNSNQQQQLPIVQWPYTPQNAAEQFLAMHFPTQASPPDTINQWQQLPYPQVFAQSASPFWQPQPPGANAPTIFESFTDTGFPGGPSPTTQTLLPNMRYQYTYPSFPCPWGPSSYMAQLYQMQHPYVYSFPGVLNFSSATHKVPDCLASGEHSSQRGIMRPPSKLSQKHQQLWEAQLAENAQLWSVINKLQAEVSDYKDWLNKLEEEVSSFKQKAEVLTNKVIGTTLVVTARYIGDTGNENVGLTSGIHCQDTTKDVLDVARQTFFYNGSFIQQGGNITPGWSLSFVNEEDASEDLEDAMEESAKDENEVMGDNTSSAAEEIGVTKDLGGWLPHE